MRLTFHAWRRFFSRIRAFACSQFQRRRTRRVAYSIPHRRYGHPLGFERAEARVLLAADLVITDFTTDGTNFVVEYDVNNQNASAYTIGIYRSSDGVTLDALLGSASGNVNQGTGRITNVTPSFTDVDTDYVVIAVLDSTDAVSETSETNNRMVLDEGIFKSGSIVYIQGSSEGDEADLSVAGGTLDVELNALSESYAVSGLTSVRARLHGGDDVLTNSDLALPIFVLAGHGDDTIYGGSGNDALYGNSGADYLHGGDGNDLLVGDALTLPAGAGTNGDLDDDSTVDADDIDLLWKRIRNGTEDPSNNDSEDLNNDGMVNEDDLDYMLAHLLTAGPNRQYGDADLDGGVGGLDFQAWQQRLEPVGWAHGDWDGDGSVGGLDFTLWVQRPTKYPGSVGDHTDQSSNDVLIGGAGDDTLDGNVGDDLLEGGEGDDSLTGGYGNDTYLFLPSAGTLGSDTITELAGGGTDTLNFQYLGASLHVNLDLQSSSLQTDVVADFLDLTLSGTAVIENAIGGLGSDTIYGNSLANYLDGTFGDDTLIGRDGNDRLVGGLGDDELQGNAGADMLFGGDGDDFLYGGLGDDFLHGQDGDDYLSDHDSGSSSTEGGNDYLTGGAGADELRGYSGNDTFEGGAGDDLLVGGTGNDVYRYDWASSRAALGGDTITEVNSEGTDSIDFTDYHAASFAAPTLSSTSPQTVTADVLTITLTNASTVESNVSPDTDRATIGTVIVNPGVFSIGDTIQVIAVDVLAASGDTIDSVDFYIDANCNGVFDAGDELYDTDTDGDDGWSIEIVTSAEWTCPGAVSFFARANGAIEGPGSAAGGAGNGAGGIAFTLPANSTPPEPGPTPRIPYVPFFEPVEQTLAISANLGLMGLAAGSIPNAISQTSLTNPSGFYVAQDLSTEGGLVGVQVGDSVSGSDSGGSGTATAYTVATGFNTPNAQHGIGVDGLGRINGMAQASGDSGTATITFWGSSVDGSHSYEIVSPTVNGEEVIPPETVVTVFGALYTIVTATEVGAFTDAHATADLGVAVSLGGQDVSIEASITATDAGTTGNATYVRDGEEVFDVPVDGNTFAFATTFTWTGTIGSVLSVAHSAHVGMHGGASGTGSTQYAGTGFFMYYLQVNIVGWDYPPA